MRNEVYQNPTVFREGNYDEMLKASNFYHQFHRDELPADQNRFRDAFTKAIKFKNLLLTIPEMLGNIEEALRYNSPLKVSPETIQEAIPKVLQEGHQFSLNRTEYWLRQIVGASRFDIKNLENPQDLDPQENHSDERQFEIIGFERDIQRAQQLATISYYKNGDVIRPYHIQIQQMLDFGEPAQVLFEQFARQKIARILSPENPDAMIPQIIIDRPELDDSEKLPAIDNLETSFVEQDIVVPQVIFDSPVFEETLESSFTPGKYDQFAIADLPKPVSLRPETINLERNNLVSVYMNWLDTEGNEKIEKVKSKFALPEKIKNLFAPGFENYFAHRKLVGKPDGVTQIPTVARFREISDGLNRLSRRAMFSDALLYVYAAFSEDPEFFKKENLDQTAIDWIRQDPVARATAERQKFVAEKVFDFLEEEDGPKTIYAVAGGSAYADFDAAFRHDPMLNDISIVCIDTDDKALELASEVFKRFCEKYGTDYEQVKHRLVTKKGDVLKLDEVIRELEETEQVDPNAAKFFEANGIMDYMPSKQAQDIIEACKKHAGEKARLLFANINYKESKPTRTNPNPLKSLQRLFLEGVVGWPVMISRNAEEVTALGKNFEGNQRIYELIAENPEDTTYVIVESIIGKKGQRNREIALSTEIPITLPTHVLIEA